MTSNSNIWTVTKIKSSFPSEIEVHGGDMFTVGGLILVKIKRNSKEPVFSGKIHLKYEDQEGIVYSHLYPIKFEFPPE